MTGVCRVCLGRLRSGEVSAHPQCARALFGGSGKTLPTLDVDPADLHLLGLDMAGRVSVSGVQEKLSVSLSEDRATLRATAGAARFILKPQSSLPELPQNEHLTMRIARVLGLTTPEVGLLSMSDGSEALVVRRFDRDDDGRRIAMEDFCQLAEKPPADKYEGSIELCVKLVGRYSAQPRLDLLALFRTVLASWWLGNGDLHLKNLSLLTAERPRLSPIYDLVNTTLVIPGDPQALTLCGKKASLRSADWMDLAERCYLPPELVVREVWKFLKEARRALELVEASFLSERHKIDYMRGLADRLSALLDLDQTARGRAKTSAAVRTGSKPMTRAEVARTIHLVESRFDEHRIRLEDTPLAADLEELDWLASGEVDVFDAGGHYSLDPERARDAVLRFVRMDRVRKALDVCAAFDGFGELLRHLKSLTSTVRESQAWDQLFELELAAQLESDLWTLAFDQADIVLADRDGNEIGIECKRPQGSETVVKNVRKAIVQLLERERGGFVAISLDLVVPSLDVAAPAEEVAAECERRLNDALATVRPQVEELLAGVRTEESEPVRGILGVIFSATFLVHGQDSATGSFVNTRFHSVTVPSPSEPASGILSFFADRLTVGQEALRARR